MLTTVIMVKNEERTIKATLSPLLKAKLKHFFILDTGSTDNTLAITHQLLREHDAIYHLVQEPFIDFSTSRNRALTLAENAFPTIPFMLMPDAEWHLCNVEELLTFCHQQLQSDCPLFLIKCIMNNSLNFYTARLFRTTAKIRFAGVVHEAPIVATETKVPDNIYFDHQPSQQSAQSSRIRWEKDLDLLLKEYHLSKQPRTTFYLAQTYECLGRFNEAYDYYQLRSQMKGWDEETFIAAFKLGQLAEHLSKSNNRFSWEIAQQHYHQAFALRPQRVDPLIHIASHYWPDNIPLCYLYIRHACDAPYPTKDIIFVEKSLYDYTRFEILSRCAWYVGEYEQGLAATKKALAVCPDTPHLLSNLKIYEDHLIKKTE